MDVRISYFQFPSAKKESTKKFYLKWQENIQVSNISCWGKVCEIHFEQDCFLRDLEHELTGRPIRKRLKDEAIPTLYLATEENLIPELPLEFDLLDLKQCKILQSMAQKLRKGVVLLTDEDPLNTNSVNIFLNKKPEAVSLEEHQPVSINVYSMEENDMNNVQTLTKIQSKNPKVDPNTSNSSRISSSGPKALDLLFNSDKDLGRSNNLTSVMSKEILENKDVPPAKQHSSTNVNIKEVNLLKQKVSNLTTQLNIQSNLFKNMKRRYDKRETVIKKLRTDLSDLRRERRKLRQREYMRKFKQKKMAEKRKERRIWICQQIQTGKLDKTSLTAVYSNKSFEKLKEKTVGSNSNNKPSTVIENLIGNSSVDNIITNNVMTKGQYQIIAIMPQQSDVTQK